MATNKAVQIGDCEAYCNKTNIEVTIQHGNIKMCVDCVAKETELASKLKSVNSMVAATSTIDSTIQIKSEIYNGLTPATIELKGAIYADESITDKEYAYAKVCKDRFMHFQSVVFDKKLELQKLENEMRMWQVETQTAAGKLSREYRDEFKTLDITYQPAPAKMPKAVKAPSQSGFKKQEMADAVKKYNMPADIIRMTMISNNCNADAAGRICVEAREATKSKRLDSVQ